MKRHKIKRGDRVKVIGHRTIGTTWSTIWTFPEDCHIGECGIVHGVDENYIGVRFNNGQVFYYERSCVLLLGKALPPLINKNKLLIIN